MPRKICALVALAVIVALAPASGRSQDVERIAAVVNEDVISSSDLRARLRLALLASGLPPTAENEESLRPQVMRQLIDETLQRQEAERFEIEADPDEVEQAMETIASNNGITPDQLLAGLEQNGIPDRTLLEQIRSTLAWRDLVRARLMGEVSISDEEIDEAIAQMNANRGQPEYLLAEIFLAIDSPTQETEVAELANQLVEEIQRGANFAAIAQQVSQSPSAAASGDIGWVMLGQLDPAIDQSLAGSAGGRLLPPIRTVGGYHIIVVRDTRIVAASNPDDAMVQVYQLVLSLPARATQGDVDRIAGELRDVTETVRGCDQLGERAQSLGVADTLDLGTQRMGDFEAPVRANVDTLPVGQPSQIVPLEGGQAAVIYMVCSRQFPDDAAIDRDDIASSLAEERISMLARRYLRDLRNAAYIDLRV